MNSRVITFFSILSVIVITIFLHNLGALGWLENSVHKTFDGISRRIYQTGASDSATVGTTTNSNCSDLAVKVAKLDLTEEENKELRKQLNFLESKNYIRVGAEVVAKNILVDGSTVRVNRGKKDGVKPGNAAIIGSGIFIGKVISVDDTGAIIRLLNDNQSKVAAAIINGSHTIGVVEGGYDISVRMNLIPQNELIRVGDQVVTSGLEPNIPSGLLLGSVEAVINEAYQPFQYAVLTPAANLGKVSIMTIITVGEEKI